jgi:hypothetical protein
MTAASTATETSTELATKCALCHLFVVENPAYEDDPEHNARWDHCDRGDEADSAITATHGAKPSDLVASLLVWERYGPAPMRRRFAVAAAADPVGLYIVAAQWAAAAGHDRTGQLSLANTLLNGMGNLGNDSVVGLNLVQHAGAQLPSYGAAAPTEVVGDLRNALHVLGVEPDRRIERLAERQAALYPTDPRRAVVELRLAARKMDCLLEPHQAKALIDSAGADLPTGNPNG